MAARDRLAAVVLTGLLGLSALPAHADVARFLDADLLPGVAGFASAADDLAKAAEKDCRAAAVMPAYDAAWDAWMAIADLRLGPSEQAGLTIAFWPDDRGFGPKVLRRMIADEAPEGRDLTTYGDVSAAARGLTALDLMLGDPEFAYQPGSYGCALLQTMAADLAGQAHALERSWQADQGLLRAPGAGGNLTYLDAAEARKAVYTQIISGLGLIEDNRLGRPLGTFEQPRPKRAEAWRTGRSLPNVLVSARAAHRHAAMLAEGPLPMSDAALAKIEDAASRITDPTFADITDPRARVRVEALAQRVGDLKLAIEQEVGAAMGITAGFNANDGD